MLRLDLETRAMLDEYLAGTYHRTLSAAATQMIHDSYREWIKTQQQHRADGAA